MDDGHILNIFLWMNDCHFNIEQKFLPFPEGGKRKKREKNSVKTLMFNLMYSKITASDMAAGIFLCTNFLHPISIGKTVVSDHHAHFPK